jgi:hypothetical protein
MLVQFSWVFASPSEETKWVVAVVIVLITAVFLAFEPKRFKK